MDRLSGVVLINRDQLAPEEAIGVTGELQIKNKDRTSSYKISIVRILPRLDVDGKYRAFVEFDNERSSTGNWRLFPGMTGKATFSPGKPTETEPTETKSVEPKPAKTKALPPKPIKIKTTILNADNHT